MAFAIALDALDIAPAHITWGGLIIFSLGLGLMAVSFSHPARRAIYAWLSRLGSAGEAQQAAAVAGLLGGLSPAKALAIGKAMATRTGRITEILNNPFLPNNPTRR